MARATKPTNADPLRPRLVVVTAAFGLLATWLVVATPSVQFAYYSPGFHVALETTAGLTAALGAFLFFGRLRQHHAQSNWALVYALALSAAVNISFGIVPAVMGSDVSGDFAVWSTAAGRLIAASAFVVAAFSSAELSHRRRYVGTTVLLAVGGSIALIGATTRWLTPLLPTAVDSTPATQLTRAMLEVHPAIMLTQLAGLAAYTAAAAGFIHRSERTGDELMRWLAAGAMLAAFSRLHYMLFPSQYSGWVYTGDLLRLGFYALLLTGAVGEIRRYWTNMATAAAAEERRRIARDLHDGLAQELAFISTQTRWLRLHEHAGGETAIALQAAADRALDESRRAISALTRDDDEPLAVALAQAAEEVAERVGTHLHLDVEPGIDVDPQRREGVIRIAREAIANAGRHSGSSSVTVRLSANGRVRLEVTDNGVGFDTRNTMPNRFGLISMRERAEALDAEFNVTSSPGRGTSVEVAL
jgi:signal transduction histidine kinase